MKKIIDAEVIKYDEKGKGIIIDNNIPITIPNAIVSEKVKVKINKISKKNGYGEIIDILRESKDRVSSKCKYSDKCGGCNLLHMSEMSQKEFKIEKVKEAFNKFDIKIKDISYIKNDNPFGYRNKLSLPLLRVKDKIEVGLYKEYSNEIIPIKECIIQEKIINVLLKSVVDVLNIHNVSVYNQEKQSGYLRQIIIKSSKANNQLLLGFVVNDTKYTNKLDIVIKQLLVDNNNIKSIVINFNDKNTNVILGEKNQIVYGTGYIIDTVNNLDFKISLNSFYQVNANQMNNLYLKAIQMANLNNEDIVLDAYCGVGTISTYISKTVKKVVGVDIVPSAIKDANNNKLINNITNVEFVCSDVNDYMLENHNLFNKIILDPPRKGATKEFLDIVLKMQVNKIVYIACDVNTQARDVAYLIQNGFKVDKVCAVDLFSQTFHIENIVLLTK
ncbi:23S rRNA (uracil(1939)-C(5))-methyltransferase RlmD [Mycoplasma sp. P36-A1]|uniref:23S rRNA (uracil(1939)-C(5))-methyltransferase RlmD n=1 Tax=Mycoplasma sp. P36-A1 TaxID=3252900 RepID=UPI003C2ED311